MPAGRTYEAITTTTLTANASSITFSGLPSNYTDIILVCSYRDTRGQEYSYPKLRINSDANSNYSWTNFYGDTASALSNQSSGTSISIYEGTGDTSAANVYALITIHLMNYLNSSTNKTVLIRGNNTSSWVGRLVSATVGLWRNSSAITSV